MDDRGEKNYPTQGTKRTYPTLGLKKTVAKSLKLKSAGWGFVIVFQEGHSSDSSPPMFDNPTSWHERFHPTRLLNKLPTTKVPPWMNSNNLAIWSCTVIFLTTKKHTDNLQECLTNVHSFFSQPFESHIEKNKKLPLPGPVHRHHRLLILCRTTLWTRSMRPVKSLVNHEGYMITPKWMAEIGWILSINNTDSRILPSVAACLWQKFSINF